MQNDMSGGFESVHYRHVEIEDNNIGHKQFGLFNALTPIRSFSTNVPAILGLKQGPDQTPNFCMIIHHKDTNHWTL